MQRIQSFALRGIDALSVEIECDERPRRGDAPQDPGPRTYIVGLPDASVRESHQRVRAALSASRLPHPRGDCLINLAPADLRKEGPVYDLPIAVALLRMQGVIGEAADAMLDHFAIAGELSLDGMVRPIRGATSLAAFAREQGLRGVILPRANAPEAAVVEGIDVYGVEQLDETVGFLNGLVDIRRERPPAECPPPFGAALDFEDVRGQEAAKRALGLAAAGGHNALLIGPAGSGEAVEASLQKVISGIAWSGPDKGAPVYTAGETLMHGMSYNPFHPLKLICVGIGLVSVAGIARRVLKGRDGGEAV